MKKSYIFLSCALAATSFAASARGTRASIPQHRYDVESLSQTPSFPLSVTGVGDEKGIEFFGGTFMDSNKYPAIVTVNSNNFREINRLSRLDEDDEYSIQRVQSGEWVNGTYYCHIVRVYSLEDRYGGWGKIDTETGKFQWIQNCTYQQHIPGSTYNTCYNYQSTADEYEKSHYYRIIDLAYNNVDGKLYGLAWNEDPALYDFVFGTVDTGTGLLTPVADVEGWCYAMTFDLDGNLYIARNEGTYLENAYNESEGTRVTRYDYKNLRPGDYNRDYLTPDADFDVTIDRGEGKFVCFGGFGTLTTDDTTGDMYLFLNGYSASLSFETQSSIFAISPREKKSTYLGKLGFNDMLVGAVILDSEEAESRKAPAQVRDLVVEHDANGANTLSLTWNRPVSNWDLTDLTSLTGMKVAVDSKDNVVTTLDADLSTESYSYVLNGLTTGAHTVYVTAVNAAGAGVPMSIEAWAGHDVPGLVGEPAASTEDGKTAVITWTAPVEGMNGGWFDTESVKYDVVRMPGEVKVAEDITELTCTDGDITDVRAYHYVITAKNADGTGASVNTNEVTLGDAKLLPYYTDLLDESEAKAWKVFSPGPYFVDVYDPQWPNGQNLYYGHKLALVRFPVDYYVATPKVLVEEGKTYRVVFKVFFKNQVDEYHSAYNDFELTAGTELNDEAMQQNVFLKLERQTVPQYYYVREIEGWFTAPTTDGYSFAFHLNTQNGDTDDIVSVQGVSIEEVLDNDLEAISIRGTQLPAVGAESKYTVSIRNLGNKRAGNFTVQVVRVYNGYEIVVGEEKVTKMVQPHDYYDVDVNVTPDADGEFEYAARIIFDDDENLDNNMSAPIYVDVQEEGRKPVDQRICGDSEGSSTVVPFGFNNKYYGYQSIYLDNGELEIAKRKEANNGEVPMIESIAYSFKRNTGGNAELNDIEDVEIQVFMSQSTRKEYKRMGQAESAADQTKVFDGKITIKGGNNGVVPIVLDEKFPLEEGKNLIVTITKTGGSTSKLFPLIFDVYNTNEFSCAPRAIEFHGSTPYPTTSKPVASTDDDAFYCAVRSAVPALWFALPGTSSGVEGIFTDPVTGDVNLDAMDNADIKVFDIAGKLVYAGVASGRVSDLPLANGMYVINITTDKAETNIKVRINR